MRFSLRTLLIVMLLAGPLCAFGWSKYCDWREWQAEQRAAAAQPIWKPALMASTNFPTSWEALTPAQQAEVEQLDKEAIVTRR